MLRRFAASLIIVGAAALIGWSAPAVSRKSGSPAAASAKSGGGKKPAAGTAAAKRRSVGRRYTRRRVPDRPVYYGQQRPAPERIQEVEQALAAKGFLTTAPDTVWDDSTSDAMRRFQQSQNLTADGKLSSMSLIALGLGARRVTPPAAPSTPPQPAAASEAAPAAASAAPPPAPPPPPPSPR